MSVPLPSPLPALPLASASPPAPGAECGRGPTTHATVLPMFSPAAQQPTKRYRTIVADPPWQFDQKWATNGPTPFTGKTLYKKPRGAVANYSTMSLDQLRNLPVGLWAMDDAHLYLWTTNSFMVEAHDLAKAWGFKVKTILTWVKPRLGMGTYYRNNTEHVIFAVRGSLRVLRHDVRTAFTAAQGAHSEKPSAFYDIVQSMSLGPYLDVFARKQRFGWDTWGDEAFDFRTDGIWHGGSDA